jgi:4-hydroxy-tetrahydrodipicolinate synthase
MHGPRPRLAAHASSAYNAHHASMDTAPCPLKVARVRHPFKFSSCPPCNQRRPAAGGLDALRLPMEPQVVMTRSAAALGIKGSNTALITPFKGGKVDSAGFKRFVEWQIAEGSHGLVPVGTTGETPTLSHEEHIDVVNMCVVAAKKRVPVIAGAGSNSTDEAIMLTKAAKEAGADAVLHSTAYYNKPTQEGLFLHFKAISDAVDIPIIVYNVPVRTITDISAATFARMCDLKNVVGIKDATANMARQSQHRELLGDKYIALSGEDATALGFNAHGGTGCISVTANIAPRLCAQFQETCLKGDYALALKQHDFLMPLHDALFIETNPAPAKYAAWRLGLIDSPDCRLPLAPLTDTTKKAVDAALAQVGLLKAKAAE